MDSEELKRRTFEFGIRVIRLVRALPKSVEGKVVAGQLTRCGTSVGANYRASCKARSKAEFIAKMGTVEEESDESAYWLEVIVAAEMLRAPLVEPLLREAREFSKIFGSSRVTALRRLKAQTRKPTQRPNGQ
jgi:four helix bundle protein